MRPPSVRGPWRTRRRDAVKTLMDEHRFTERQACGLVGISRSSLAYQARPDRHARLRERLITLSGKHRRYGYRMLHAKLVREGFRVNVKVVERIYREEPSVPIRVRQSTG